MRVETIAQIAHEANLVYCLSHGDTSQKHWEDAPQWQRESAIKGVLAIQSGSVASPEGSHEGWMKEKAADGWKYGPTKDEVKKEHPCFVPFDQLPLHQQHKDVIFFNLVRTLLALPASVEPVLPGV